MSARLKRKAAPKAKRKDYGTVPCSIADPAAYGLICEGNCLSPLVRDGEVVIVSPAMKVAKGMIVTVNAKTGSARAIKRLGEDPPPRFRKGDEVEFTWTLEMDNPPKRLFLRQREVGSVHAVAGVLRDGKFVALTGAKHNEPTI